jgi:hypothetical protein
MKTMTLRSAITLICMLALGLVFGVSQAHAGNMDEALGLLERAKHSEHEWHIERSIEHLRAAKHHLEISGNDTPQRAEAVHQIDEALHSIHEREFHRYNEHIERAIHLVREGMRRD